MSEKFDDQLSHLAQTIADAASGPDVPLSDRIDAFKALTSYYVGTSKLNKRPDDDEDGSFVSLQARIQGAR